MGKYMFFTFDGGGNQPPTIGIALGVKARGHDVSVVGYESQRRRFEEAGLSFTSFEGSGNFRIVPGEPAEVRMGMGRAVMFNAEHLVEVPMLAADQDAVVIDNLLMMALCAAEQNRIPHVALFHTAAADFKPNPMRAHMVIMLNRVRALHGLAEVSSPLDLTNAADAVIVAVLPELDGYSDECDGRWHHLGPVLPPIHGDPTPVAWDPNDQRPLVLVSLSTTNVWGPVQNRLQRILDGLAELPVRVLLTTGDSIQAGQLRCPANATIRDFCPHRHVMPEASVCVTHGGHATLAEALAQGVPMVFMPNPMADQPYLAGRVSALGAGVVIDENAAASDIRRAVGQVLGATAFREAAAALGARIDPRAAERAAEIIEGVAAAREGASSSRAV